MYQKKQRGIESEKHRNCIQSKKSGETQVRKMVPRHERKNFFSSPFFSSSPTILFTHGCQVMCWSKFLLLLFYPFATINGKTRMRQQFFQIFSAPVVFPILFIYIFLEFYLPLSCGPCFPNI